MQDNRLSTQVFRALQRNPALTDDDLATSFGHPATRIKKVRAELEQAAAKRRQRAEL
jgi:hypothetical protein